MKHTGSKKDASQYEDHEGNANTVIAKILHGNVLHREGNVVSVTV